jgi:nucleoside-diphosphate-sugar epimerase
VDKGEVLVVGGAGYIGGYLTDLFAENGYNVAVYDNLLYETRFLKRVKFIHGDIRDTRKLFNTIHYYKAVVWLAGMVGDGACQVDPQLTNELNFESVKWLVDNYHGKILFPSTCSVYGVNDELIDETAEPNPLSAYASTKLAAEQYILGNRVDSLIFRLGTLYGLGDSHSRLRLDLVVNILTKRAVEGQKLSVFGGEQWRPLLHVRDVAKAFLFGLDNGVRGLYNLSACNMKIAEIAEAIKGVIPTAQVEYKDIKFEDLRNYRTSTKKILDKGWRPTLTLQDGILELQKVFQESRISNLNDPVYSNQAFIKNKFGKEDD